MNDRLQALIIIICGIILGGIIGWDAAHDSMRGEAVEKGYAQYHPNTGDWEWLEVKEVK